MFFTCPWLFAMFPCRSRHHFHFLRAQHVFQRQLSLPNQQGHVFWSHKDMRAPWLENVLWWSQMEKQGHAAREPRRDESLPNRPDQNGHIPAALHSPILARCGACRLQLWTCDSKEQQGLHLDKYHCANCFGIQRSLDFHTVLRFSLNPRYIKIQGR